MFFYKYYTFSPLATLCSVGINLAAALFAVFGIAQFSDNVIVGVILVAVGLFLYFYVGKVIPDKVAEKNGRKNIETKANYALTYCIQNPAAVAEIMEVNEKFDQKMRTDVSYANRIAHSNPQYFDALAEINPELAEKYFINEKGKVAKIK
ncbi:MAG: hypothetical protein J6B75_07330 [Ruminococcus sp.]|nr:hypothetical protein [Ruminococcus sp.]